MNAGTPRSHASLVTISKTRPERITPATSNSRNSRVNSSTTARHFNCWPLAQASNTKSCDQAEMRTNSWTVKQRSAAFSDDRLGSGRRVTSSNLPDARHPRSSELSYSILQKVESLAPIQAADGRSQCPVASDSGRPREGV